MLKRFLTRNLIAGGLALAAAGVALAPAPAAARVVVGLGIGVPLVAPAPVYYPPYYYPPAPAYYPPPTSYYPPPAGVAPAAAPAPQPTSDQCREYSSTQIIAGAPQQVFGTACRQPDGSWRIMG